jgi:ribosomal-protein-alanine N-acetyltransferase
MSALRRFLKTAFGHRPPTERSLEELRIRPMGFRDVDAVYGIEHASFGAPWRVSSYGRAVSERRQHFFVAEFGRQIVGYGGFWVEGDRAHVAKVAVHPELRRRGIGSAIVERLLEEICRLGLRDAYLEVRRSNTAAQELYRRFGFRFQRVQPHTYPDNGEDALVFSLRMRDPGD